MSRFVLALVVTASLLAAGCGSDADDDGTDGAEGSGDETTETTEAVDEDAQAYIDALAGVFYEDALGGEGFEVTRDEATCVAATMVGVLGTAPLVEAGVTPEDIASGDSADLDALPMDPDEQQAEELWDGINGCIDLGALVAAEMTVAGLSDESAACIGEGIVASDPFRDQMIGSMVAPDDVDPSLDLQLDEELDRLVEECLTPEEMAELGI